MLLPKLLLELLFNTPPNPLFSTLPIALPVLPKESELVLTYGVVLLLLSFNIILILKTLSLFFTISEMYLSDPIFIILELFSSLCSNLFNDTGIDNAFLLSTSCLFNSFAINLNSCNIKLSLNISNNFPSDNIYSSFNLYSNPL